MNELDVGIVARHVCLLPFNLQGGKARYIYIYTVYYLVEYRTEKYVANYRDLSPSQIGSIPFK